jgi:hypothetical protein
MMCNNVALRMIATTIIGLAQVAAAATTTNNALAFLQVSRSCSEAVSQICRPPADETMTRRGGMDDLDTLVQEAFHWIMTMPEQQQHFVLNAEGFSGDDSQVAMLLQQQQQEQNQRKHKATTASSHQFLHQPEFTLIWEHSDDPTKDVRRLPMIKEQPVDSSKIPCDEHFSSWMNDQEDILRAITSMTSLTHDNDMMMMMMHHPILVQQQQQHYELSPGRRLQEQPAVFLPFSAAQNECLYRAFLTNGQKLKQQFPVCHAALEQLQSVREQ